MKYTIDNAKWTDYGWEDNIFQLSYGDFIDEDGDEFHFRIEYRKETGTWHFFMEYVEDEIIFINSEYKSSIFFLRHMDKELMESTKVYMEKLMQ